MTDDFEELREWYRGGCGGQFSWSDPDALTKAIAIADPFIEDAETFCRRRQAEVLSYQTAMVPAPASLPDTGDMAKSQMILKLLGDLDSERAARSAEQMEELGRIVAKQLLPDIERLEEARVQLVQAEFLDALAKQKQPIFNVNVPEQPAPIVHAEQTHHIHVPEQPPPVVEVHAEQTHNINVPEQPAPVINVPKQPKPEITVNMPHATPTRSKISRDADGNIMIERSERLMPADWSVTPQDQASIVITPTSPESLGVGGWIWGATSFGSGAWTTANLALFIPFIISVPTTIVGGGPYNGTTLSGGFDVGVYDEQGNKLVSSGSVSSVGTSAWQVVSLTSTTLNPGTYYMALGFGSGTATVFTVVAGNNSALRCSGVLSQTSALPLPAKATFAIASGTVQPLVALTTRTWI